MADLIAGLIDVFADTPLTGNPLPVVQGGGEHLDNALLRQIAGEFNQAASLILPSTPADRRLRQPTGHDAVAVAASLPPIRKWNTPHKFDLGRISCAVISLA